MQLGGAERGNGAAERRVGRGRLGRGEGQLPWLPAQGGRPSEARRAAAAAHKLTPPPWSAKQPQRRPAEGDSQRGGGGPTCSRLGLSRVTAVAASARSKGPRGCGDDARVRGSKGGGTAGMRARKRCCVTMCERSGEGGGWPASRVQWSHATNILPLRICTRIPARQGLKSAQGPCVALCRPATGARQPRQQHRPRGPGATGALDTARRARDLTCQPAASLALHTPAERAHSRAHVSTNEMSAPVGAGGCKVGAGGWGVATSGPNSKLSRRQYMPSVVQQPPHGGARLAEQQHVHDGG